MNIVLIMKIQPDRIRRHYFVAVLFYVVDLRRHV